MYHKVRSLLALTAMGTLSGGCNHARGPDSFLHIYTPEVAEVIPKGDPIVLRAGVQICDTMGGAFPVRVFLDGMPLSECVAPGSGAEATGITTLSNGELLCVLPTTDLAVGQHDLLVEVEIVEKLIKRKKKWFEFDTWKKRCHRDNDLVLAERATFEITQNDDEDSTNSDDTGDDAGDDTGADTSDDTGVDTSDDLGVDTNSGGDTNAGVDTDTSVEG
ncbi:hypothetical protein L6R46_25920 [Myxococcota bacterium]|nr:hypothetical protein [Myxococcota bacterium]